MSSSEASSRPLATLLLSVRAGFWGEDLPHRGYAPVRVVRNGDAARSPRIEPQSLPLRWMTPGEVANATVPLDATILVSSGDVGRVARLTEPPTEAVVASNFVRIVRPARGVSGSWLFHLLASDQGQQAAHKSSGGTTIENLSVAQLKRWPVAAPDQDEQDEIARVLDVTDERTRKTVSVGAKLAVIKRGLIHALLMRGLDSDGRLRDASRHPEVFCDTSLGLLPKTWTVEPIGALLADRDPAMRSGPFGSALLKHELVPSGVPLLGIDNVHVDRFDARFTRFVTARKASELARYRVFPDDVMITIMGTVGRSCLVPKNIGHALSSKHVWTVTFDQSRYLPYLASSQINHASWLLAQLRRDEQGGIMAAIRSETLRAAEVPVPPRDEQLRIEKILRAIDRLIAAETAYLAKLRLMKPGLASELLFGKQAAGTTA